MGTADDRGRSTRAFTALRGVVWPPPWTQARREEPPITRTAALAWLLTSVVAAGIGAGVYASNASVRGVLDVQLGRTKDWAEVARLVPSTWWDFALIGGYGTALVLLTSLARALFRSDGARRVARAAQLLSVATIVADIAENVFHLLADELRSAELLVAMTAAAVIKWACLPFAAAIAVTALVVTEWRLGVHLPATLKRRQPVKVEPPDPLEGDRPAPRAEEVPGTGTEGNPAVTVTGAAGESPPMEATRWRRGFAVPELLGPGRPTTERGLADRGAMSGFCLSGGGIRSGSVALGALQSLRLELLSARYLVSVSGGGYTAGALQMALTPQTPPTLDPEKVHRSPLDAYGPGSVEEDRFRRHVRYLADSPSQLLLALGIVARGVVLSLLVLFAPAVLLGAVLGRFYAGVPIAWVPHALTQPPSVPAATWWAAGGLAGAALLAHLASLALGLVRRRTTAPTDPDEPERLPGQRLRASGTGLTAVSILVAVVAAGLPWLIHLAGSVVEAARDANSVALEVGGPVAGVVLTYVMALVSLIRKKKVVERTGGLFGKKDGSGTSKSAVAAVPGGALQLLLVVVTVLLLGAAWLFLAAGIAAAAMGASTLGAFWYTVLGIVVVLALLGGLLDQTSLSLHPFYRRSLARAFAARRVFRDNDRKVVAEPYRYDEKTPLSLYAGRPVDDQGVPTFPEVVFAAAANLTGEQRAPLGATSFTFTSSWLGGPDVGYARTEQVDGAVSPALQRDLTVQAAVAVSGAAFASAMGRAGRWYGTLLAISGLRLGSWLPNPAFLAEWDEARLKHEYWTRPGLPGIRRLSYLFREVLGTHRYRDRLLHVTDGGHYENLGLVEVLRRRCSLIFCIDASGDRPPTAGTLEQAVALAWQELGVHIELPDDIWQLVPGSAEPLDPGEPLAALNGRLSARNAVAALVCYPEASDMPKPLRHGLLVVGKALLTRDMNYDLLSYASRNAIFPHDSTGDQFFKDDMFTAYAALGRHTGRAAQDALSTAWTQLPELCPSCGHPSVRDDVRAVLLTLRPPVELPAVEVAADDDLDAVVETRLSVDGRLVLDSPSRRTVSLRERIRTALW
jgi:hypothetical protein